MWGASGAQLVEELRRKAGVPGSIPGKCSLEIFKRPVPFFLHSVALGSNQPVTEMSTIDFLWG
jgi:hypothetical protein